MLEFIVGPFEGNDDEDYDDDDNYEDEYHYKNGDYKTDDKRLYFDFDVDEDDSKCEDIHNYTRISITPADFYDNTGDYFDDWFGPTIIDVLAELDFDENYECVWSCWRKVTADELKEAFAKIGWKLTEFPNKPVYRDWYEAYEHYEPEENE